VRNTLGLLPVAKYLSVIDSRSAADIHSLSLVFCLLISGETSCRIMANDSASIRRKFQ